MTNATIFDAGMPEPAAHVTRSAIASGGTVAVPGDPSAIMSMSGLGLGFGALA